MNIFKRRRIGNGPGNLNPKRLGIMEEIYGEDLAGTDDASNDHTDTDEVLLLENPIDENGQLRSLKEDAQKAIYLGKPRVGETEELSEAVAEACDMPAPDPRIVLLANVKGGCGKSTTAMHLALYLLDRGYSVGTIDLDGGQGTLTRMLQNRRTYANTHGIDDLPAPEHRVVEPSAAKDGEVRNIADRAAFTEALGALDGMDFIVIDTPGHGGYLTRLAHRVAGRLITPVNDSFVDLDVFARIEDGADRPEPGVYTRMVMDERDRRAAEGEAPLDWVVVRNRLSHLYARNKAEVAETLENLSAHFDFRLAAGFGERVVFREFFAKGLTLLDLRRHEIEVDWSLSHVAAREELRQLLEAVGLSEVANRRKADSETARAAQPKASDAEAPQSPAHNVPAEKVAHPEFVAA